MSQAWVIPVVVVGVLACLAVAWASLAAAHDDMRRRVNSLRVARAIVAEYEAERERSARQ